MKPGRRAFIAVPLAAALAARAQGGAGRKRVAFVGLREMFEGPSGLDAVARALAERGYADGRQIDVARVVVPVLSEEEMGRGFDYLVPILEKLVAAARPDVLVCVGSIMAGGLQRVTRKVPIVTSVADPVAMGLAQSLGRPGGNVTGTSAGLAETSLKAMEFMKRVVPGLARVVIFHDGRTMASRFAATWENAARQAGLEAQRIGAIQGEDLMRALRDLPLRRGQAGLLAWRPPDGAESFLREALSRRLPMVGTNDVDADEGALVAYMAHDPTPFPARLAAIVVQVLRGGDPATIPFVYPTGFRLVVNQRTAASLGLAVPADLLLLADRVIA